MVVDRESGKKRNIFYRIFSVIPRRMKTNLLACLVFRNEKKNDSEFQERKTQFIVLYIILLLPCICNRRITIFLNLSCCYSVSSVYAVHVCAPYSRVPTAK